ncbi:RNAse III [Aulographum hederae CBS 113979]|uniref:RNAse III n=1 Tax=Aulographum hederae CBS 113979 TaxID=1176131 RepID=A0A6G1GYG0_9PEZI|nr:RNAse III [Aulographum hederae CBS 113979]
MAPLLSDATREALEGLLHHTFANPDLLWEALQAPGARIVRFSDRLDTDGNKRLALLGDACLRQSLVAEWLETEHIRRAQNRISTVLANNYLAQVGQDLELERYINNNRCQGSLISVGTMATTVEALVGAVFLDSGMDSQVVQALARELGLGYS